MTAPGDSRRGVCAKLRRHFLPLVILVLSSITQKNAIAQDLLQQAQQFERAGDPRNAVAKYSAALQGVPAPSTQETELRGKIIDLALRLTSKLPLPEEARRHGVRAAALVGAAQNGADREAAAAEYRMALKLAPWWADAYFNYGLLEEALHSPGEAVWAYRLYLRAAPDSADKRAVQDRIYAQEALAERAVSGFAGRWRINSGSLIQISLEDNRMTMTEVEPSPSAAKGGYKQGMVIFVGTVTTGVAHKASGTEFAQFHFSNGTVDCTVPFTRPSVVMLRSDGREIDMISTRVLPIVDLQACRLTGQRAIDKHVVNVLTRE